METKEHLLLSAKDVSAWLGIPMYTIYSWALSRRIPHYKIGKKVLFSKDELKRWVDTHRIVEAS
jgi:excisionase family DNA binding protein